MAYGPVLGPAAPAAADPFGRSSETIARERQLAEESRRRLEMTPSDWDRWLNKEGHNASPLLRPPAPSLARPHVGRPDAGWDALGSPDSQSRRVFEQHVGIAPDRFMDRYMGPGYHHRDDLVVSGHPGGGVLGPELEFQGGVFDPKTGEKAGNFERVLRPRSSTSYHALLSLYPEFQNQGIGRKVIDNQIDTYGEMTSPINKVGLYAALDGGGYNWPKRGWLPEDDSDNLYRLNDRLWHRLGHLKSHSDATPEQLQDVARILNANRRSGREEVDPEVVHDIIDGVGHHTVRAKEGGDRYRASREYSLAKHMLRGLSFKAVLDRNNHQQMERFNATRAR